MTIASGPYATALFALAAEREIIEEVETALDSFVQSLDEETEDFFLHPGIAKEEKRRILRSLSGPGVLLDFLCVLIDNNRISELFGILEDFRKLKARMQDLLELKVHSRKKLSSERLEAIKEEYQKHYNRKVTVENTVDDAIVGGLRFEFDGKVVDDTINRTLDRLKSRLTK